MLNIGVIGAGIISGRHFKAIAAHNDTRLAAVADIDRQKALKAAEEYGAEAFDDYGEMLSRCRLDAVVINLPHALHESCAVYCAQKGVHVFLEKPMSISFDSCLRIIDACRENGVLLQIGHVQGYDRYNRTAKAVIDSGKLGRLVMLTDRRSADYFTSSRPRWFLSKQTAGGGIWLNYGAHALDKLCYLTSSRIRSISGQCTYPEGLDVDGSAQALAVTENGVSASISICGYKVSPFHETHIYLTEGEILLRPFESVQVKAADDEEFKPVAPIDCPDAFASQWADFVSGIKQGRILRCGGEYGAHIIKFVEQLWE
ncbi:MAG: Gfo/Idh/MocA family oxidoreductase [Clostridia bacterium]|nr:Gfo/Idh/MocA family oxidoreductase [Clostridia bacterium]